MKRHEDRTKLAHCETKGRRPALFPLLLIAILVPLITGCMSARFNLDCPSETHVGDVITLTDGSEPVGFSIFPIKNDYEWGWESDDGGEFQMRGSETEGEFQALSYLSGTSAIALKAIASGTAKIKKSRSTFLITRISECTITILPDAEGERVKKSKPTPTPLPTPEPVTSVTLTVRVISPDGEGVPDAKVSVKTDVDFPLEELLCEGRTNNNGDVLCTNVPVGVNVFVTVSTPDGIFGIGRAKIVDQGSGMMVLKISKYVHTIE